MPSVPFSALFIDCNPFPIAINARPAIPSAAAPSNINGDPTPAIPKTAARPPITSAITPASPALIVFVVSAIIERPKPRTIKETPTSIIAIEPNVIVNGTPVIIPASYAPTRANTTANPPIIANIPSAVNGSGSALDIIISPNPSTINDNPATIRAKEPLKISVATLPTSQNTTAIPPTNRPTISNDCIGSPFMPNIISANMIAAANITIDNPAVIKALAVFFIDLSICILSIK